ncbi:MAG: MamI family restriction endonuclease [Synergistaceae bacterium]|nr:MamI family restriction endonuclease [Synergistaceae bacterium]
MQPNINLITIGSNIPLIREFIYDMIIIPRQLAHKWAAMTNQTPNLKTGYPSQHLASLIVGMRGTATGARGNDIIDGSEVKACSKVDQMDKCNKCGRGVLRSNSLCPYCGSHEIIRKNDSKWLINIRSKDELRMALDETPRFIFIIADYPCFNEGYFGDIRIRAFEIWPQSERCRNFRTLLQNYYNFIYLKHIEINPDRTPAPKNLWPDSFQFYMCNPIKVFECVIGNALFNAPFLEITYYVEPYENREYLQSELMPSTLLRAEELDKLNSEGFHVYEFVDENMRSYLELRASDRNTKNIGTKKHKKLN